MRISSLNPNTPPSADTDVGKTRFPSAPTRPALPLSREPSAPPARRAAGGLGTGDPKLNRQLASAQQSLDYLDQLAARLGSLKSELSAKLAGYQPGDADLDRKLRDFTEAWRERQTLSGGSLDGRLGYSGGTEASQHFRIRGIDLRSLQTGDKETLTFSVGGDSPRLVSVTIEPELSAEALIRRLDHAFAPANIRVIADKHGEPSFSVPESAWPALRDSLAVKGKGIRFPSGQLTRVKTMADAEAIRPDAWQTGDVAALRRTLQEVVDALDRVQAVREAVGRVLAEIRSRLAASPVLQDGEWASTFAADFETLARDLGYPIFSAIAPALTSINRHRVVALLSLD